ncbi:MAG: NAD-dependent epimerase/dehydratase family protein [Hydrogenophilales bacterium]|nr:NAD-dependent epimerase/dehydratase family protein [Hydrogenophilales bacterium]
MKSALVCGAGGFIGHHLVSRLKDEGMWVCGVDIKPPEFSASRADEFKLVDLRDPTATYKCLDRDFDEVYQLAADMGGAGYVFTGENCAAVMHNSALININVVDACRQAGVGRVFFSSSACVYPLYNQQDPQNPTCAEATVYPALPDSEYGWEKLFAERLYLTYARNYGMTCRIARYHNIFGPEGTWQGGREKAPAALCRKVAMAEDGGEIEIWGDGEQTRSFLYIDECLEATLRLMRSDCDEPLNIGSDEMISIDGLAQAIAHIAGKKLSLHHIAGPTGVRGRTSDNRLIRETLGWAPSARLNEGLKSTYRWIAEQVAATGQA